MLHVYSILWKIDYLSERMNRLDSQPTISVSVLVLLGRKSYPQFIRRFDLDITRTS